MKEKYLLTDIDKVALVLTGCIKPSGRQSWLVLTNIEERLRQYVESIFFYVNNSPITKIIFCDNSNYCYDQLSSLKEYCESKGKILEWLSFNGDSEMVAKFDNKGVGEDEIMDYVVNHSNLILTVESFVKITGRLLIYNINDLISFAKFEMNYFYKDLYRGKNGIGLDTRFYIMDVVSYKDLVYKCYARTGNYKVCYETTFYLLLKGEYSQLPSYPRFYGVSSGNGIDYGQTSNFLLNLFDKFCQLDIFDKFYPVLKFLFRIELKFRKIF